MTHWLEIAKKLPSGHRTRFQHCGSDEAAVLFNKPEGYSLYCHRCGHKEFYSKGYQSFQELMQIKKLDEEARRAIETNSVRLPHDFTPDIPPEGMIWLLKASITPKLAREAGFGWTPHFKRVVLPVYQKGKLVYYQARAVLQGQEPKYLNPKVDRASILYWTEHSTDTSAVVLTEDILSAERVARATGIQCASILGTKVSDEMAGLLSNYDKIIVWLDSDKAGRDGARKLRKTLGLVADIMQIVTPKDPKRLSDQQIINQFGGIHEIKLSHTHRRPQWN